MGREVAQTNRQRRRRDQEAGHRNAATMYRITTQPDARRRANCRRMRAKSLRAFLDLGGITKNFETRQPKQNNQFIECNFFFFFRFREIVKLYSVLKLIKNCQLYWRTSLSFAQRCRIKFPCDSAYSFSCANKHPLRVSDSLPFQAKNINVTWFKVKDLNILENCTDYQQCCSAKCNVLGSNNVQYWQIHHHQTYYTHCRAKASPMFCQ